MSEENSLQTIRLPMRVGGALCFDFTNTAAYRGTPDYHSALHSYRHVLAWAWRNGLLGVEEALHLEAAAARRPEQGAAALQAALDLRERLYAIFSAVIEKEAPAAADRAFLDEALAAAWRHRRLEWQGHGFRWGWGGAEEDLRRVLWPVTLAAAEMLTADRLDKVKRCPNCGWLFVDTSRNGTRRWCSMAVCGSQDKSRRQYQRQRGAKGEG